MRNTRNGRDRVRCVLRAAAWLAAAAFVTACAARTSPAPTAAAPTAAPSPAPAPAAAVPAAATTRPADAPPAAAPAPSPRPPAPAPLVGHVARIDLEEYVTWKQLRAQDYTPDPEALKTIAARGARVEILAVVGTWCGDSKREVPRFFKIADLAHLPLDTLTLVAVDRSKKDAGGLTEKHAITRVPTFVFFRNGQEIGRIVERPKTTLENDIAEILK